MHLRYEGDHDELYFRDYLQEYPAVAKDYEKLKRPCGKNTNTTVMPIQRRKRIFIKNYTDEAKKLYGRRYERENR
ncbi:GrpB family protein [Streptococcus sanguinis]|uniref:GrpB family protein n=1 Tax=Streptococcus sanguinis TaxID=1305 RepID=A0A7Y0YS13_STRSA|nr:GrpB family protein [Streptococcus sanguinis]